MDISLSKNIKDILEKEVLKGKFSNLDEAIDYTIRYTFLGEGVPQKYIDTLNNEIEKGFQEMKDGLGKDSKEVFKNLRKKYC